MLLNSTSLSNLNIGFKASFQKGFAGVSPMWAKIATEVPSTTLTEEYGWLGEWPMLREWIGDRFVKQLSAHSYSIKNKKFETTVSVKKDDIDDDRYGIYNPMMESMGQAAALHPDQLVFDLLKDGFSNKCYDGQFFFDTDHPVLVNEEETSVSNMQAGSNPAWFLLDTSRPLKPMIWQKRKPYNFVSLTSETDENVFMRSEFLYGVDGRGNAGFGFWQMAFGSKAELTKENFRAARTSMISLKGDTGKPLGIRPNILVVGSSNADKARDLILAEREPNGATNVDRNLVEIFEVPWLD